MTRPFDCDVLVVGAGGAALTAAISARNEGARVIVLEKTSPESRSGNCPFTGGGYRFWHRGLQDVLEFVTNLSREEAKSLTMPEYSADVWYNKIMEITEERADPKLAELLVTESTPTLRWLKEQGLQFELDTRYAVARGDHLTWKPEQPMIRAKGGGKGLSDALCDIAVKKGVQILYQTKAVKLLLDSGDGIGGVTVLDKKGLRDIRSKAVVMACGGFESNREMRARYLGPGWDLVRPRGTSHNTGEGLRMALDIGAQPAGHWSGCHATTTDYHHSRTPEGQDIPALDDKRDEVNYGIQVNCTGNRFIDEGEDSTTYLYAKIGAAVLQQPGIMAWQIFDAKGSCLLEPSYRTGSWITANTIEELSEQMGIPAVTRTIAEFNDAVQEKVPLNYSVKDGRGTVGIGPPKSNWAQKLDTPPFVAYSVGCGITFTFGGLKIDTRSHVLSTEGEPINGLYAAGEVAGGVWHKNYVGGSGVILGAVLGRIAGANAATD